MSGTNYDKLLVVSNTIESVTNMRVMFGEVFSESKEAYIFAKVKASARRLLHKEDISENELESAVAQMVHSSGKKPILVEAAEHNFNPEQSQELEARTRCALATLYRISPLLKEESIKEDFFTYLAEDFEEISANTTVLKRITNQAEIYYFFDDIQVLDGDLHFQDRKQEAYIPEPSANAAPLIATLVIFPIISSVVSSVAGKIATAAIDHIIQNLPPQFHEIKSFFAEDYTEISKMIKSELAAEFISQIDGRVQGTLRWISNTYLPRKASLGDLTKKENRQELFDQINHYSNMFYTEVIAQLMQPEHSKMGLSVFTLAGSVPSSNLFCVRFPEQWSSAIQR